MYCSRKSIGCGCSLPRIEYSNQLPILISKTSSFDFNRNLSKTIFIPGKLLAGNVPWHGTDIFQKHSILLGYGCGYFGDFMIVDPEPKLLGFWTVLAQEEVTNSPRFKCYLIILVS